MEQKVEKQASLESVPVKRLKRELKYQGTILKMYEDTVEVNGHQAKWDFIHHDGAAAVLPVTEDGKILMVHARIYSPTVRIGHIMQRISKIRSLFTSTPKN